MKTLTTTLALMGILLSYSSEARTIRATELKTKLLSAMQMNAKEDLTIEFRDGDELPVSFTAKGDLLETSREGVSYVRVKRDFWVRILQDRISLSLDGREFKPIQEMLTGSFMAGAGSEENGGIAHAIQLGLDARLK